MLVWVWALRRSRGCDSSWIKTVGALSKRASSGLAGFAPAVRLRWISASTSAMIFLVDSGFAAKRPALSEAEGAQEAQKGI